MPLLSRAYWEPRPYLDLTLDAKFFTVLQIPYHRSGEELNLTISVLSCCCCYFLNLTLCSALCLCPNPKLILSLCLSIRLAFTASGIASPDRPDMFMLHSSPSVSVARLFLSCVGDGAARPSPDLLMFKLFFSSSLRLIE